MSPDRWASLRGELERLRVVAAAHQGRRDPERVPTNYALCHHHEAIIIEMLQSSGWEAHRWGQGILSDRFTKALRSTKSPLRWSADVIAVCGSDWAMIDAKAETRIDTAYYSIEKAAASAMWGQRMAANNDPHGQFLFVWHDFRVSNATDVMCDGMRIEGPDLGNGSGTPFYLYPKSAADKWTAHFAHPIDELAAS